MRILKRSMFSLLLIAAMTGTSFGADYGLPVNIQDGNILHCFNWPAEAVKAELPNIAAAGFGAVQLSPLQRPDVKASGTSWHDLYRPYDLAFKSSDFCTEADLKDLCTEAAKYGIKVIVDVVANHVDKTSGYHDTWWDSNGRVRWEGPCNYGNRYSITHGQLGDYGDVNSESPEVQTRGKAYVEFLKNCGVKGIRWDAAKHIATPNEGCGFWSTVTSVPGMWHYGEILNDDGTPIEEYAKYMSVTDNEYSNSAAKNNNGIQGGYGGKWAVDRSVASNKLVYWGESHDTYSNDEWSQNVDQSVIDRAYACVATRNGATALYLSRPNVKGFNNIKTAKGSTAYKSAAITAVNKLRNAAGNAADYCTTAGDMFSCTRQGIGAVIVKKGSGSVNIANGGSYCPAGTYIDLVSGGSFTVTASTISGNVGSSGIAVIMKDGVSPTPDPTPDPNPGSDKFVVYFDNSDGWSTSAPHIWAWTSTLDNLTGGTWPGVEMTLVSGSLYKWESDKTPAGIIFTNHAGQKAGGAGSNEGEGDILNPKSGSTYNSNAEVVNNQNPDPDPNPNPDPDPVPGGDALNTDYYKVNPNGQVGSNRTVNVSGHPATNALNNWTSADLIAQGVARDVCQAFRGVHERPIVDSYSLYAAYDSQNLYLGVQYVYSVWDRYGEGFQAGESKPYNMDGKLCLAFDLDPNKKWNGVLKDNGKDCSVWQGDVYTTFDNGVDAIAMMSTKPGVGTPGFFVTDANGNCSYSDPNTCKKWTGKYGYADGLLPSIDAIYGQGSFNYNPSALWGNEGFVDIRSQISELGGDDSAHTFYEWSIPLSLLGVTENYIKTQGIGVMVVDFYGASAHASLPYDPSFYDNVNEEYSMDPSSSKEKEDKDVVTYTCARIGKAYSSSAVETLPATSESDFTVAGGNGTIKVFGAEGHIMVAGIDGNVYFNGEANESMSFNLNAGMYIVNVNGRSVKALVK